MPPQLYTFRQYLLNENRPKRFYDAYIKDSTESFSCPLDIAREGIKLATLPRMQLREALLATLHALVSCTTLPNEPGQIDMRLTYAHTIALLQSDRVAQPELHAEYRRRLGTWAHFVSTIPLRMQLHCATLLVRETVNTRGTAADTRYTASVMQQATQLSPVGLPSAAAVDVTPAPLTDLPWTEMLCRAVEHSTTLPGLPAHDTADDATWSATWHHGITYGHDYAMRAALWCVSMFWAAFIWNGRCGVCGGCIASWYSHAWVEQVDGSTKLTVGYIIDHWFDKHVPNTSLLLALPYMTLSCTSSGQTCCGRPAVLQHRFGNRLPRPVLVWTDNVQLVLIQPPLIAPSARPTDLQSSTTPSHSLSPASLTLQQSTVPSRPPSPVDHTAARSTSLLSSNLSASVTASSTTTRKRHRALSPDSLWLADSVRELAQSCIEAAEERNMCMSDPAMVRLIDNAGLTEWQARRQRARQR